MTIEFRVRAVSVDDFEKLANIESIIIIEEVLDGNLPLCDLGDLSNRSVFLEKVVGHNRLEKIKLEAGDKNRKTFLVEDNFGNIFGKGCIRFDAEKNRAVIYSFNVLKSARGSVASLLLLKACFREVDIFEQENHIKINTIRASRYEKSEVKKPFFSSLMELVNSSIPNSVFLERYQWHNEQVLAFNFPKDMAKDLLDELGGFYAAHLV